jgi:DNA-binding NarL/FixJ family response regulator
MRCLIVDDNPSFLEAAHALLEREGVSVVGSASTCAEALSQVEALRPDVVLVDLSLGEESGFDLAHQLEAQGMVDRSGVILISTRSEADLGDLIAATPAAGFIPKLRLSAAEIRRKLGASD